MTDLFEAIEWMFRPFCSSSAASLPPAILCSAIDVARLTGLIGSLCTPRLASSLIVEGHLSSRGPAPLLSNDRSDDWDYRDPRTLPLAT